VHKFNPMIIRKIVYTTLNSPLLCLGICCSGIAQNTPAKSLKDSPTAIMGLNPIGLVVQNLDTILTGRRLFINSGYAKWKEKAENVLLSFSLPSK
jgi:hypothetical protein